MPIYVYRCDDCGEKFERLQKMSDPDPDTCPRCHKRHHVRRQVTAAAFRLVGSGWYETDFKSGREEKHNLAGDAGKPSGTAAAAKKPAREGKKAAKPATAAATS